MNTGLVGYVLLGSMISAPSIVAQQPPTVTQTAVRAIVGGAQTATLPADVTAVLNRTIDIDLRQNSLREAIAKVAHRSGVRIHYQIELLEQQDKKVTLRVRNATLESVLSNVLSGTSLTPVVVAPDVLALQEQPAQQQSGIITGKVVHAQTKQPLAGVKVFTAAGAQAVVTGEDGTFRIQVNSGQVTLSLQHLGFTRQNKQVTVGDGENVTLAVELAPAANVLNEVIVTGTVIPTERRAISNPITVITAEEIERRGITRVEQLLRGEVPGVIALDKGVAAYNPGSAGYTSEGAINIVGGRAVQSNVYSRGVSTLESGGATPQSAGNGGGLKTYVDGVELADPSALGTIDPRSIERIEIITGPQAATIYGSGAINGVMQIFTKRGTAGSPMQTSLQIQYGVLQSNLSNGKTPSHNDVLSITGSLGPGLSYSLNGGYQYQGKWLPGRFNRSYSGSAGGTFQTQQVTIGASLSATRGSYGVGHGSIAMYVPYTNGDWEPGPWVGTYVDQRIASNMSQSVRFNMNHRVNERLQQSVTVGRSQMQYHTRASKPNRVSPMDSLYSRNSTLSSRSSWSYNAVIQNNIAQLLSSSFTIGLTGSAGGSLFGGGCLATETSYTYVHCGPNSSSLAVAIRERESSSYGVFGSWLGGFWDHLYVTLGLRGERSSSYGTEYRVDWTPTNGVSYVFDWRDISVKFRGSYGRATREPRSDYRDEVLYNRSDMEPGNFVMQQANDLLRPERSWGPQGGMEIYIGSVGSLGVNRYTQTVQDLVQSVQVDSLLVKYTQFVGEAFFPIRQYQNVGSVKSQGWELTGSAHVSIVSAKGTYSWTESRVKFSTLHPAGSTIPGMPTHTGHVQVDIAHGGFSVGFTANYLGAYATHATGSMARESCDRNRIKTYIDSRGWCTHVYSTYPRYPGYVKSDGYVTHRLNSAVTFNMNVTNISNSFRSDNFDYSPSLGRQTLLGLSLRYPR